MSISPKKILKLLALVFVIVIGISSICNAVFHMDPDRWLHVGFADDTLCSYDAKTIKYTTGFFQKSANLWVCYFHGRTKTYEIENVDIDYSRKTITLMSCITYDYDGKIIDSKTLQENEISPGKIVPGSLGEALYEKTFPK